VVSFIERKMLPERLRREEIMRKMMKKAALVLVFGLVASVFTFAQDWRDVNRDRRDIRHDRADIRQDYAKLRRDEYNHNWQAVRRDKAEINHDRADVRHDGRDIRHDYRYRNGW
jgi:hypothetical protein